MAGEPITEHEIQEEKCHRPSDCGYLGMIYKSMLMNGYSWNEDKQCYEKA
jgi:hypothetical protein